MEQAEGRNSQYRPTRQWNEGERGDLMLAVFDLHLEVKLKLNLGRSAGQALLWQRIDIQQQQTYERYPKI